MTPLRPSIPLLALFYIAPAKHSTPAAWNRAGRPVRIFRACGRPAPRYRLSRNPATQARIAIFEVARGLRLSPVHGAFALLAPRFIAGNLRHTC
jgi:hypothetical protein